MNEKQFSTEVDRLFLAIEAWLESTSSELDFESHEGMLTLALPNKNQIVLSRQTTLQEVWLASPLGAYHFRYHSTGWRTAQGKELLQVLVDTVKQQTNITLNITHFPQ